MPTDIPSFSITVGHQPTSDARHGHRRNKERERVRRGKGKQKEAMASQTGAYAMAEPKDGGDTYKSVSRTK